jgi:hypothetical protein
VPRPKRRAPSAPPEWPAPEWAWVWNIPSRPARSKSARKDQATRNPRLPLGQPPPLANWLEFQAVRHGSVRTKIESLVVGGAAARRARIAPRSMGPVSAMNAVKSRIAVRNRLGRQVQCVQNRTIGAVIAMTGGGKALQCTAHRLQRHSLLVQFLNMPQGDCLHLG